MLWLRGDLRATGDTGRMRGVSGWRKVKFTEPISTRMDGFGVGCGTVDGSASGFGAIRLLSNGATELIGAGTGIAGAAGAGILASGGSGEWRTRAWCGGFSSLVSSACVSDCVDEVLGA
ncbi:hypothetical protein [Shimia sp.]|uniref:hypothetical protein n=1 Tax=Shimia sp. TaxID=1954381 RepID=UPI003B8B6E3B